MYPHPPLTPPPCTPLPCPSPPGPPLPPSLLHPHFASSLPFFLFSPLFLFAFIIIFHLLSFSIFYSSPFHSLLPSTNPSILTPIYSFLPFHLSSSHSLVHPFRSTPYFLLPPAPSLIYSFLSSSLPFPSFFLSHKTSCISTPPTPLSLSPFPSYPSPLFPSHHPHTYYTSPPLSSPKQETRKEMERRERQRSNYRSNQTKSTYNRNPTNCTVATNIFWPGFLPTQPG